MDKKPLIGVSICAVVLLILGSLSNVVGYQSVKSMVNDSPLFQTRTQRATNQQSNILTSQYLGVGKGNLLQFPIRDNRSELLRSIFELMNRMDYATLQKILAQVRQRLREITSLTEMQFREIDRESTKLNNITELPVLSQSIKTTHGSEPTFYACQMECFLWWILTIMWVLPVVIFIGLWHTIYDLIDCLSQEVITS